MAAHDTRQEQFRVRGLVLGVALGVLLTTAWVLVLVVAAAWLVSAIGDLL